MVKRCGVSLNQVVHAEIERAVFGICLFLGLSTTAKVLIIKQGHEYDCEAGFLKFISICFQKIKRDHGFQTKKVTENSQPNIKINAQTCTDPAASAAAE